MCTCQLECTVIVGHCELWECEEFVTTATARCRPAWRMGTHHRRVTLTGTTPRCRDKPMHVYLRLCRNGHDSKKGGASAVQRLHARDGAHADLQAQKINLQLLGRR